MITGEAGSIALGLMVLTAPAVSRLRRLLLADDLMIRPDGAGRLLLHSDAHDRKVDPNGSREHIDGIATEVIEAVFEHLDVAQIPPLADAVVGIRALTADLLPAVGWTYATSGIYLAVTHSGITLAPRPRRAASPRRSPAEPTSTCFGRSAPPASRRRRWLPRQEE